VIDKLAHEACAGPSLSPARPSAKGVEPMSAPVLEVAGLRTEFETSQGSVAAVADVSLTLAAGQVLGLVGESGSGKSVTGYSILGLIDPPGRVVGGSVRLQGQQLVGASAEVLRSIRGRRIAMVFQDPMMTLNPVLSVETHMVETLLAHEPMSRGQARSRAVQALSRVGIAAPEKRLSQYPHEFSGGMRQRVSIAIALLHQPVLIIADEPTTALDVTVQGQILYEMQRLVRESGTALIWITHDLAVVAGLADRIAVMYAGRIVEQGPASAVLDSPAHPYTRGLLDSVPSNSQPGRRLAQIPGTTPSLAGLGSACAFAPRCHRARDACAHTPDLVPIGDSSQGRSVRCHFPLVMPD
jgi:peptide/nickel transport system ATP-binding protein